MKNQVLKNSGITFMVTGLIGAVGGPIYSMSFEPDLFWIGVLGLTSIASFVGGLKVLMEMDV